MNESVIREAVAADAGACAAIYAPYVRDTAITFEEQPPGTDEMAARIADAQRHHVWLVLLDDGDVVGYAYAHSFHSRPAYRWSCESSIYLQTGRRRRGEGRRLYEALLPGLAARGFRTVIAGMTLPNDAGVGLHTALGFRPVGVLRRIGWKHDEWRDVAWMQLDIGQPVDPPAEPV